jgi:hypothetical protein
MITIGIDKFCSFNSPVSFNNTEDDLNMANYETFLNKIGDFEAINETYGEGQRESFGVGIFKMFTIISNLEESDYLI